MIELDGAHHAQEDQVRYDQDRTEHLEQYGYHVVRFPNAAVLGDLDAVLDRISIALSPGTTPSPREAPPSLSQDWEREGGRGEE